MLRALVVAVIAANLLFFAWARGWLAPVLPPPQHGEREPERLAQQVRPETIRITPIGSAPGAPVQCLEAGPFGDADVGVAEAALLAAGVPAGTWTKSDVQRPGAWLVYMGRFADAAAARAKQAELKRLDVDSEVLAEPPDLAPGVVISRHETEAAADEALAKASQQRGVRTAKVVPLPPPPVQHWLRAERVDALQRARFTSLKPPTIAAAFGPCRTK